MAALTGDDMLGRHPLDLLSRVSNAELATIGNYGDAAYIRFYNSNNPASGHIFGLNAAGHLFASNVAGAGAPAVLRTDVLQVGTIVSTSNSSNIYMPDVNIVGLSNLQIINAILDKDGNPYTLGGGGTGSGGFAEPSVYFAYNPLSEATRVIQTNDTDLANRVLFSFTTLAGRYFLNGTVAYKNVDTFVPIDSTNWASVNVYNGTLADYVGGTATLVQMTPFYSTSTTPDATMYFNFNTYVDALGDEANARRFVVAIEGAGHRLSFTPDTVSLKAIPVQTSTGLGSTAGEGSLYSRSIQINPLQSVFTIGPGETCNLFNLVTPGNFVASSNSCHLYLNGTKMVYLDDNRRDYSMIYNYNSMTSSTVFTVALAEPAVAGDVVDVTIYPELTTSNAVFNNSYFYQATSVTSAPWLKTLAGGLHYPDDVVIGGRLIVQGDIVGGCNLLTSGLDFGAEFDTRIFANLSCNVIGSVNIAPLSILPRHLNLTNGNVGIGTTNPLQTLDVRGSVRLDGQMYDSNNTPIWLPSTSLQWQPALTPSTFTVPGGGAVSYSRCNTLYRWIGDDIAVNFNLAATVTVAPTGTLTVGACNYLLGLPYPLNTASYPAETILGDLWLTTTSSNAGGTSNTFKAYARSVTGNSTAVAIRALTGTTDESLVVLAAGTRLTLQGSILYRTTSINQSLSVPAFYTPAKVAQDQAGNIGINLPDAQPPRSLLDVYASNATATLVVDQASTGDIAEFKASGATKVVIDAAGQLGVGTGAPSAPVDLVVNSSNTGAIIHQMGTGPIVEFKDLGVSKVVIDGNGNVGIGTTAPRGLLNVVYNGSTPTVVIDQAGIGDLLQLLTGGAIKVVVSANGNIGIGTTAPTEKLQVDGLIAGRAFNNTWMPPVKKMFTVPAGAYLDVSTAGNTGAKGFYGGFTDGRYAYLVPYNNGARHGILTRVDLTTYTTSGVTYLDVSTAGNTGAKGFFGGFTDGRYAYLVPFYNGVYHGILTRVDLNTYTTAGVTYLDVSTAGNTGAKGFIGGFTDGRYAYLVPYNNGAVRHGILTRALISDIFPHGL